MNLETLFGTDGIRGEANSPPLTPGPLTEIGQAFGTYWRQRKSSKTVLLGHDGRLSHDLLEAGLVAGLIGSGLNPHRVGLCSTPSLAFLCRELHVCGGIMISASHNPFEDNGIKPFRNSGQKFSSKQEKDVLSLLDDGDYRSSSGEHLGQSMLRESWLSDYVRRLTGLARSFDGHVVVDCANGGPSRIAPSVLEECTRELTVLNNEPDGTNINDGAGSLHPEVVAEAVNRLDADIGFSLDGDGDRVVAVDEGGTVADGDVLMYLLASVLEEDDKLPESGLVVTSMSNLGLRLKLEEQGLSYKVVGVGDRLVYSKLRDLDWRLGGEQSGHIIDRKWLPTGDGLYTLIAVMNGLISSDKPLSHWSESLTRFPQILHNISVDGKPPIDSLSETQARIEEVKAQLGRKGRVVVRYSGTEPVARIMLEGPDEEQLNELAVELGQIMKKELREKEGTPA